MKKTSKDWFEIRRYKTLPRDLEEKVENLKKICFNWQERMTQEEKTKHYDRFCSKRDVIEHLLALEKNSVIGLSIALKRKITFKNKKIILGGVGGLCVLPEKRRKKVATSLLKATVKELKNANCNIAYLCTNLENPGMIKFYSRFGFTALGRPHTYLGKSGKQYKDKDAMIAPINSVKIFQEVKEDKEPFNIGTGNW